MNIDFARQQMVQQQVRAWDVFDADILEVLSTVPRERFVPSGFEMLAFADAEIPLGHGQYMMTPTVEGRLLQALGLRRSDDVLEVGTGSGFLCACLARLTNSVTSMDIYADFLDTAAANLEDAGIDNIELLQMDAMQELPDRLFDAIAVTGSIQDFDPRFVMSLKPDGRLFVIVGNAPVMDARIVHRIADNDWRTENLFETEVAPLVNAVSPPQFSF
ncbi:MAG: protein-L-isoaspartate O-methyltransferase [Gammaproteobacteria bacterium]|nr:protein-L-isoaspartate O-methyltransferase [Gammaproteobacteria bacterium]